MKINFKILVEICLVCMSFAFATAQNNYRNRGKSSTNSQQNGKPREQGRTLGLIRPLLGLGLSSIARPLVGYDVPFTPVVPSRPSAGTSSSQSDPYGYGNYGGFAPNYYNGYNYYGGYPLHRPISPFYNAYRPQFYPAYYGGYPQYNGFGGQRPLYSNSRPRPIAQRPIDQRPIAQRPIGGQQPASYPSITPASPSTSGTTAPAANSAQASQIANLLGQLLGQQLRPLLNQGASSQAHDELDGVPNSYQNNIYRNQYYRG